MRNRKRGVTYVEVVVASAFVAICAATLADSLNFSLNTISYTQRRTIIQSTVQSAMEKVRANALSELPTDGTATSTFSVPGGRTVTLTQTLAQVSTKNLTKLTVTATWPESRGSREFTDSMKFELYLRGPE